MEFDKKIAKRNQRSEGLKRGSHGGTRRAYRSSKRGAKVMALRVLRHDDEKEEE